MKCRSVSEIRLFFFTGLWHEHYAQGETVCTGVPMLYAQVPEGSGALSFADIRAACTDELEGFFPGQEHEHAPGAGDVLWSFHP